MRTLFAASLALLSAVLLSACSSSDPGSEDTDFESTADPLSRGSKVVVDPPPPPPPKGPKHVLPLHGGVLAPPNAVCAGKQRFDLRRQTRSCEDLPGAYLQGGATLVPGTGGHFRVGRLLAGTSAPAVLQAKACSYTWEPDSCAEPDKSKLLVETAENLVERSPSCLTNPAACGPATAAPSPPRFPSVIPNGTGRCDVCGFGTGRSLWVVLPQYWPGFRFTLANESTPRYVYIDPPADASQALDETTVVEVPLPFDVIDQDVSLVVAYD